MFFALLMATIGVSQTSAMGSDSAKAKASASSIFAMIDRESKIDSSSDDGMVLANVAGELEFHHVCFSYPSRPDIQIFRNLSLRIPSGKVTYKYIILPPYHKIFRFSPTYIKHFLVDGCPCRRERLWQINRDSTTGKILRP